MLGQSQIERVVICEKRWKQGYCPQERRNTNQTSFSDCDFVAQWMFDGNVLLYGFYLSQVQQWCDA